MKDWPKFVLGKIIQDSGLESMQEPKLTTLNKEDNMGLQQKSLASLGAFLVLRGNKEYTILTVNSIIFERFKKGQTLEGQRYVE